MADTVKCPVCGEDNSAGSEFCQYCQSRIQPLTGNLRGENAPITPGESPTKKSTADLEPILPQWLRDARSSARDATEDDLPQTPQQPKTSPRSAPQDLLAGLRSQSDDDEEETPDWLTNITGGAPSAKKPKEESSNVRWVELGGAKNSAPKSPTDKKDDLNDWMREVSGLPQEPAKSEPADSPDWIRQLASDDTRAIFDDSANADNAASEPPQTTSDWLSSLGVSNNAAPVASSDTPDWQNLPSASAPSASADTPDWLKSLDAADSNAQNTSAPETPDWLNTLGATNSGSQNSFETPVNTFADAPASSSDTPDWLKSLDAADSNAQNTSAPETPDWLKSLDAADSNAQNIPAADTPDWLKSLDAADSNAQNVPAADTPDWLKGLGETPAAPIAEPTPADDMPSWMSAESAPAAPVIEPQKENDSLGDVPSWLKSAAPQSSIFDDLPAAQPAASIESSDTPDWLNSFKSLDSAKPTQVETPPTFGSDASSNADALFTDMPDWLSNSIETPTPSSAPETTSAENELEVSQLPSWVQSMRPVDNGVAQIASAASGETPLEARGALAGLQGVLPAAPNYAPTSKPKAYSLKLQATDEQVSQAGLLEQILAAETSPVPIASFSTLRAWRGLRWSLAFIFFAITLAVLILGTQIFSLPVGIPLEVDGALQAVQSIPQGNPVLVAFDYEPARVAEMEAAAAPVFDQLSLHAPRLTFIATNENSAVLIERFMFTPLMSEHQNSGLQYLNLGYLPGGQMGIRAFAQNPRAAISYDVNFSRAWDSPQLQDVNSFSNFAAFILVTDSADSARAWLEQISSARGAMPVIVISSAQSAPMIQPYYASGQITGLVGGLQGGAIFEQNNNGRPGTARIYWDAYSIGMLIAAALILIGGLWNLFAGSRDRTAAREAK